MFAKNTQRVSVLVITLLALVVSIGAVSASQGDLNPYIQINNGNPISVTRTEQPQISVQFGNRGRTTLDDVSVICFWDGLIRLVRGNEQTGPFGSSQFAPPSTSFPFASISFPSDAGDTILLPQGQNYNVGFNIRLAAPVGFTGEAGTLRCNLEFVSQGQGLVQSSQPVTVNVH